MKNRLLLGKSGSSARHRGQVLPGEKTVLLFIPLQDAAVQSSSSNPQAVVEKFPMCSVTIK